MSIELEALAVVGDFHANATVQTVDQDFDSARIGVFGDVYERLLGDSIECGADDFR